MVEAFGKDVTELLAFTGLFFICIFLACILFPFITWAENKMLERKLSRMRCPHCGALTRGYKYHQEWSSWHRADYCSRCGAKMAEE